MDHQQFAAKHFRPRWRLFFLTLACLLGISLVACSSSGTTTGNATGTATPGTPITKGIPGTPLPGPPGDTPIYWQAVQQSVAQALHLSVAQIKTKLTTPIGTDAKGPQLLTMFGLAQQQGIAAGPLQTIELTAIQQGYVALVTQHIVTQVQADQGIQAVHTWNPYQLEGYITAAFVNH